MSNTRDSISSNKKFPKTESCKKTSGGVFFWWTSRCMEMPRNIVSQSKLQDCDFITLWINSDCIKDLGRFLFIPNTGDDKQFSFLLAIHLLSIQLLGPGVVFNPNYGLSHTKNLQQVGGVLRGKLNYTLLYLQLVVAMPRAQLVFPPWMLMFAHKSHSQTIPLLFHCSHRLHSSCLGHLRMNWPDAMLF